MIEPQQSQPVEKAFSSFLDGPHPTVFNLTLARSAKNAQHGHRSAYKSDSLADGSKFFFWRYGKGSLGLSCLNRRSPCSHQIWPMQSPKIELIVK
jgi:hypothetical protein